MGLKLLAAEKPKLKSYPPDSVKTAAQYYLPAVLKNKSFAQIGVAVNGGRLIAGLPRNRLDFISKESDECVRR